MMHLHDGEVPPDQESDYSNLAEKIEARIEWLRNAVALTDDEAIVEVGRLSVTTTVPVIKALLQAIAEIDLELDQAYQNHAES